jgi:hypothetical protein
MASQKLFELIERLADTLPLSPSKVSEVLGVTLKPDPEASGPMFDGYTSNNGSAFKSVELRVSVPDFGQQDGILIVKPADSGGIDSREILNHYGLECKTDVPSPRYPPEMPVSMSYTMPWGELSFGVSRDEAARLVQFVMKTK